MEQVAVVAADQGVIPMEREDFAWIGFYTEFAE